MKIVLRYKKYLVVVVGLLSLSAFGQNKSYADNMAKNLLMLDSAKSADGFIKAAENFEKLAKAEKKEWLPYYYAGLCHVLAAFEKKGKEIDASCDKADQLISKADSLSANNSEIVVLKSMSSSARINVNVIGRGQKYGAAAFNYAEQAIRLNANNPRAYLQKATAVYYTPAAFGGGAKKAKPVFETALEKYKLFRPVSKISPDWGKDRAQQLLKELTTKINTTKK